MYVVADRGAAVRPWSPSGLSAGRGPQKAKNFAWADGHWVTRSTYQANMEVGLPNLLSAVVFHESKWSKARWRQALRPESLRGSLQRSTKPPSWIKGTWGKGGEKKKRGGKGRRKGRVGKGSEFGQDNGLTEIQGARWNIERDSQIFVGPMDFYRFHYLKVTF